MILNFKNTNVTNIKALKNLDINKIVYLIKLLSVKKVLNILLVTKILKELNLEAYFLQKWVHIEKPFMKLNLCLFDKRWWIMRKT